MQINSYRTVPDLSQSSAPERLKPLPFSAFRLRRLGFVFEHHRTAQPDGNIGRLRGAVGVFLHIAHHRLEDSVAVRLALAIEQAREPLVTIQLSVEILPESSAREGDGACWM
ncbi:MAG: hypothetical protein HYR63_27580 [Proteobacteria bacterium]|nr:hypothetical protein [Pseudomonadota bacterium]